MDLKMCKNGHYYDADRHAACPFCNVEPSIPTADHVSSWVHRVPFLRDCTQPEFTAAGSHGKVYKVRKNGTVYALKVINCGSDPMKLRGAQYEIFLMNQLHQCKGVVHLIDSYILRTGSHAMAFLLEEYATPFETY